MNWRDQARRQGGAITRRSLMSGGMSRRVIDRLLRDGDLVPRMDGIYVVGGTPDFYVQRLWVATLWTRGILGYATAAHLWGLIPRPDRIDVIKPDLRPVVVPGNFRVHRQVVPDSAITAVDDLPMTARTWSLIDHLGTMDHSDALVLMDRALQQRWITRADVIERLAAYPGRTGNTALRRLIEATGDKAAAKSERLLHQILTDASITGWVANHPIRQGNVLVAVADVAFPDVKLVIEVDGYAYHSDVERFQHDRRRGNALSVLGWTVLHFTWHDLARRPGYVATTIADQLRRSA